MNVIVGQQHAIYPFIDGTLLTETPGDAFASGAFNQVPVMTGTNHDEYRYFVAVNFNGLTAPNYVAALTSVFGPTKEPTVLTAYPQPPTTPANARSSRHGCGCMPTSSTTTWRRRTSTWTFRWAPTTAPTWSTCSGGDAQ